MDKNYGPGGALDLLRVGLRVGVCDLDVDFDLDQLVSCGGCQLAVHQSCYGVSAVPGPGEPPWVCRVCEVWGAAAAEERGSVQSQLAGAYCTLAEKHMEGSADVAAVEEAVEDALRRARHADGSSPEPLQVRPYPAASWVTNCPSSA